MSRQLRQQPILQGSIRFSYFISLHKISGHPVYLVVGEKVNYFLPQVQLPPQSIISPLLHRTFSISQSSLELHKASTLKTTIHLS
mgnify:CR=1 FL=1